MAASKNSPTVPPGTAEQAGTTRVTTSYGCCWRRAKVELSREAGGGRHDRRRAARDDTLPGAWCLRCPWAVWRRPTGIGVSTWAHEQAQQHRLCPKRVRRWWRWLYFT